MFQDPLPLGGGRQKERLESQVRLLHPPTPFLLLGVISRPSTILINLVTILLVCLFHCRGNITKVTFILRRSERMIMLNMKGKVIPQQSCKNGKHPRGVMCVFTQDLKTSIARPSSLF